MHNQGKNMETIAITNKDKADLFESAREMAHVLEHCHLSKANREWANKAISGFNKAFIRVFDKQPTTNQQKPKKPKKPKKIVFYKVSWE